MTILRATDTPTPTSLEPSAALGVEIGAVSVKWALCDEQGGVTPRDCEVLAKANRELEEYEDALALFAEALEVDPTNETARSRFRAAESDSRTENMPS